MANKWQINFSLSLFTADDKKLINSLRQSKGYSSRRFLKEFLQKY